MKLEYDPIVIQRSQDFEEEVFGISDVTVIMEILRSKLYSNPIKVLVQEYMSNARDAHREVDKDSLPIEVTCPTDISPQFEVRDFGPGLTPDRIKNVFVKYGSSTKRDSNNQTGGYGIGAKSAWSYADTFHVISITRENDVNIKRSYSCVVDESRAGKLVKMSDDEFTTEPCGTRIVVPARKENFRQFKAYAIQTGSFWKTLPIIHGETLSMAKTISEGANWKYFVRESVTEELRYNRAFVIYDGIPYPLKTETLKDAISEPVMKVLNNSCFGLYFDIGDITISANREEIQYTEKTRKVLANRVNELVEDVASKFSDTIQKETTFLNALLKFNAICQENRVIGDLLQNAIKWNEIQLNRTSRIDYSFNCAKIERFYHDTSGLNHRKNVSIEITPENIANCYVNDEPRRGAPINKMRSLYYSCKDKTTFDVYVISYHTNNPVGLTQQVIDQSNKNIKLWKSKFYIDNLDMKKVSSIVLCALPKIARPVKSTAKLVKFKKISFATPTSDCVIVQDHEEYDDTVTGNYIFSREGRIQLCSSHYNMRDSWDMRNFAKRLRIVFKYLKIDSILVFTPKFESLVLANKGLVLLKDISDEIVRKSDIVKIKEYADYIRNHTNVPEFISMFDPNNRSKLTAKNGFKDLLEVYNSYKSYSSSKNYNEMQEFFSEFRSNIETVLNIKIDKISNELTFHETYPLLTHLSRYNFNNTGDRERYMEHAIRYINQVDNGKL